jgi:uncharacterized protein YjbI with pentapeptide repeats
MLKLVKIAVWIGGLSFCGPAIDVATAECVAATEFSSSLFKTYLSQDCTKSERESRAIDAAILLAALKQGQIVDLKGVVVRGKLTFDTLPLSSNPPVIDGVINQDDKEIRVITAAVSVVDSVVLGTIVHRSSEGTLFFGGPVNFAGTTFEQAVDLSRSIFTQAVTLSGAIFLGEGYFVQGHFLGALNSEKTAFGPHTRFHRSQFHGPVTFQQSGFSGLAEFLEVTFDQDANLSRTYFKSGTGFSGSQFKQLADFSEALFDGDAFFTFTRFDGDVFFRRATFRATADFDDAIFNAREDFSKAYFEQGPQFARTKRSSQKPEALGIENPQIQYAITLSLLVFSAVLIAYLIRSR